MNVKRALTRKFGPLPAWAWALIAVAALYYYRKYRGGTGVVSGTGTGSVGPAPSTPQAQTTLQPGESVYDPNTGALVTAPGSSGGNGGSGTTDGTGSADALTQAMNNLADAIATGMPSNQTTPGTSTPSPTTNPPPGHPPGRPVPPLRGKGAVRAPSGHNKPAAKRGFTIRGLGNGFWEYVPKRTTKSKGQEKATGKTSKHVPPGHTEIPRSATTHRTPTGGRTQSPQYSVGALTTNNERRATAPSQSRLRQPTKTPAVQAVVQQRRPASTPGPAKTAPVGFAPRPSAPPPRTQRAPARVPAPPPARKRK